MADDYVFAIQERSVAARHEKELTAVGVWTCHVMMPYERGARKARQRCGTEELDITQSGHTE